MNVRTLKNDLPGKPTPTHKVVLLPGHTSHSAPYQRGNPSVVLDPSCTFPVHMRGLLMTKSHKFPWESAPVERASSDALGNVQFFKAMFKRDRLQTDPVWKSDRLGLLFARDLSGAGPAQRDIA